MMNIIIIAKLIDPNLISWFINQYHVLSINVFSVNFPWTVSSPCTPLPIVLTKIFPSETLCVAVVFEDLFVNKLHWLPVNPIFPVVL